MRKFKIFLNPNFGSDKNGGLALASVNYSLIQFLRLSEKVAVLAQSRSSTLGFSPLFQKLIFGGQY